MSALPALLLPWYDEHKRDLPWRGTYTPYDVWISEIMLQQTQMERGVSYFRRWMERFPDLASLAAASEEEVLHAWEGLGYYSRARNLLAAARRIPFGEETVIGYLYAKEQEFTAIRSIFAGRAAGLDGETIRARLRETYV